MTVGEHMGGGPLGQGLATHAACKYCQAAKRFMVVDCCVAALTGR